MKRGEVDDEIGENSGLKGHVWRSHAGNPVASGRHATREWERDVECVEVFCGDFYCDRFNFAYSSGGFVGKGQRAMENKDLIQIVLDE